MIGRVRRRAHFPGTPLCSVPAVKADKLNFQTKRHIFAPIPVAERLSAAVGCPVFLLKRSQGRPPLE